MVSKVDNNNNQTLPSPLTPKQEKILQTFTDIVTTQYCEGWKQRHLILFLQDSNWNMDQALADMDDLQDANYGLLATPPTTHLLKKPNRLLGCENDQGTSCYLDALLFAMYIGQTSFDAMLLGDPFEPVCPPATPQQQEKKYRHRHHRFFSRYQQQPSTKFFTHLDSSPAGLKSPALHIKSNSDDHRSSMELQQKHHLQRTLRLFVNKLRNGKLVKASTVGQVRRGLAQNGWYSQDPETHQWQQEDVSELFLFLTSIFDQPYLPFQLRLFHGANKDMDDDRIMTDRLLPLSLPTDQEQEPIRLENILVDHFYNSVVTGVKRNVDLTGSNDDGRAMLGTSWTSSSSTGSIISTDKGIMEIITTEYTTTHSLTHTNTNDTISKGKMKRDNHDDSQPMQTAEVDAWQAMELLPFYSSSNEQGDSVDDKHYLDTQLVLPIVLKRYKIDPCGGTGRYIKETRPVLVPESIPFHQFVNQNTDNEVCSQCTAKMNYVMTLKSVVCHQGSSPHSGHYIAYAKLMSTDSDIWLKFDDLNIRQRIESDIKKERVLEEASKQGYLFFYELNRLCPSCLQSSIQTMVANNGDQLLQRKSVDKQYQLSTSPSIDKAKLLAQEQQHIDEWYPSSEDIPPLSAKSSHSTKSDKCLVM
ncbi:hypothetical protein BC941DRAFT_501820 [Chlamydoabsidia padenii]|nr:hypothetical protein BC941DRAFT_501820 [Chlamydoabsidia padenii]